MGLLCLIFALSQANQKVPVMYYSLLRLIVETIYFLVYW